MAKGCDSSWSFAYAPRVTALVNGGYKFIGRYLNRVERGHDELTSTEVSMLSNAGIYIVSLYETGDGNSISHFTQNNGIADARDAIALAQGIGMPTGYPIYFCVDCNVYKRQMATNIVPYFQGVISILNSSGYKLGIYGSKPVCKYIRGTYSATTRYTMIVNNSWGQVMDWSADELAFDAWNIKQYAWDQPLNEVVTIDYDESASVGGGGWLKN